MSKVREEVDKGRARWIPLPGADECLLTPRFVVDEGWRQTDSGAWKRKVRCIDDLSASGVNAATSTTGRVHHDGLDTLVSVLRRAARGRRVGVRFRKEARARCRRSRVMARWRGRGVSAGLRRRVQDPAAL